MCHLLLESSLLQFALFFTLVYLLEVNYEFATLTSPLLPNLSVVVGVVEGELLN